jgi:O-acetyl-ADP-ribose deacetylase (regulator of RNase III)
MSDQLTINGRTLRLMKGDITDLEIESFVYYAQHDLTVGSGYGTAIAVRGGPSVQEELKQFGTIETCDVVVTAAGEMKAKYIVHAVGPRFQEEDIERKLRTTVENALKQAEAKGITAIAFPAMGVGFYGVPLSVSARVMLETLRDHLTGQSKIKDVVVCLLDNREYKPFQSEFATLGQREGVKA